MTHLPFLRALLAVVIGLTLTACGGGNSGAEPALAPAYLSTLPVVSGTAVGTAQADNVQVDSYVREKMATLKVPGLTLAVMQDGKIVYAKAYGYASLSPAVPAKLDDRFEIASNTKSFAAVATMLLVEDGKLGLDDKISKYLGPVPAAWDPITVRQLLNHTSGLPEFFDLSTYEAHDKGARYSQAQYLEIATKLQLVGQPGGKWIYSNVAYDLVGFIIEKVSGKYYGDFLQQRVFGPLDMRTARVMHVDASPAGTAIGYIMSKDGPRRYQPAPGNRDVLSMAASGIEASALDMAKWDAALHGDKLLTKSSRAQMWTISALVEAQVGSNKIDVNYGLGWFLTTINGHRKVYHSGGSPAFTSDFIRYVDDGLSVVILTNIDGEVSDPQPMTRAIARMFNPAMP